MRIPLDRQNALPLYQQIERYLREQILSGQLAPETRLPASRQLAQELGVSRITVNNAYAQLESEGLLYSREGSGVYVLPRTPAPPVADAAGAIWPLWQQAIERDDPPYESRATPPRRIVAHPKPIAFTGVGDRREFPIKEFVRSIQDVVRRDGAAALAYGGLDQGYTPLRTTLTHVLGSQGIQAHPDHVLITSGSQQALALVCQVLLKPGDVVLVESPTYNLALELFRVLDLQIVGAPVDEQGMCVERLEPLLQRRHPRLIYTIPNFQNPTGSCLSGGRRRQLVALADRYNIPVLEDDFVGDLRYEGRVQPALKTLDPGGRVIYTGTFSKMLMPGLRVGFLVAEGPVFKRLVDMKRVSDLTTPTLMQRALEAYVNVGRYQAHVRRSGRLYRQRRDAMLAAIRRHLPAETEVIPPHGGLFIWLRLPEGLSCLDLLPLAAEAGVEYAPGTRFFPIPADGESYLRLNFATQPPAEIEEGIRRLASALHRLNRSVVAPAQKQHPSRR
ncbi:MAG: PLP-dependent aminotransferase family protein [Caldilineaceae bacterium]|nr:PLP-dependent aminotransferase family protein [Caldilineaceae bacterium]